MSLEKLNQELNNVLETYRLESISLIDMVDDPKEPLTKHDMENMSRLVYYSLSDFKDLIIKYVKETSR